MTEQEEREHRTATLAAIQSTINHQDQMIRESIANTLGTEQSIRESIATTQKLQQETRWYVPVIFMGGGSAATLAILAVAQYFGK